MRLSAASTAIFTALFLGIAAVFFTRTPSSLLAGAPATMRVARSPSFGLAGIHKRSSSGFSRMRREHLRVNAAASSFQGTTRAQNEDRYQIATNLGSSDGQINSYFAVYDGHGGDSTSEWLTDNLFDIIKKAWSPKDPKSSLIRAYESADEIILQPRGGFIGIGAQRGVGGAKCGSTAVSVIMYEMEGKKYAVTANIGDSMVIRKSGNDVSFVTVEHVPDNEEERKRIEMYNPNPKLPLVRFVGKTWRVGGLLALSRAFGDAYLKPSLDFEGVGYQDSDYMSGFGLIARPDVEVFEITPNDKWMVVASDGLFETEIRGGGGGLTTAQIDEIVSGMPGAAPQEVSAKLAQAAIAAGSTDDVTVIFVPLS